MKSLIIAALLSVPAYAGQFPSNPVDLNEPGVLEQLKEENPARYEAVTQVLTVGERLPCTDREIRMLSARYDVREMACHAFVLTSLPPKRRLSFEIEGTRYAAIVTLKDTEGRIRHAKE